MECRSSSLFGWKASEEFHEGVGCFLRLLLENPMSGIVLHNDRDVGRDKFDRYKSSSLRIRFINSFEGNWSSSTFRAIATPATGSFRGSNRPTWTRIEA